jgi:REP element-mobilizing transposase RayT
MAAWLLTSTCYGTWLPCDPRGSVTSVRDLRPGDAPTLLRFEHDMPGEPYEDELPGLQEHARESMTGPPVYFDIGHANTMAKQFPETATHRGWQLLAFAVMYNHIHIVVDVPGFVAAHKILGDFKAYGSRALNKAFGKPASETWWTYRGSKRILRNDEAVAAAIHYVLHKQPNPLVTWFWECGIMIGGR